MSENELLGNPGLFRRLIALFYDSLLLFALSLCCVALIIAIRVGIEGTASISDGERAISGIWRLPTFILVVFACSHFYIYFWTKSGQTLGMQTWKLRLDNPDNKRVTLKQAYIRCLASIFSASIFGLGYLWVLFGKDKLSWHDKISGTHLVLLPKR